MGGSEDLDLPAAKRLRTAEPEDKEDEGEGEGEDEEEQSGDADGADTQEDEYFAAYDDIAVHLLMLQDKSRVDAYAAAIRSHRARIEGKVVLDVGAGSGVLSLLAAKLGGAARVYAVEAAEGMAKVARGLVAKNGLDDVVSILEGLVEEVDVPEQVDVIISEWMGFYLLHESMLDSVLSARDKWLKQPDGLMLPGSAKIFAALAQAEDFRKDVEGLANVHGLDLSDLVAPALHAKCAQPQVELISPTSLLTPPEVAVTFADFRTVPVGASRAINADVRFRVSKPGIAAAIAIWFDVGFPAASSQQDGGQQEQKAIGSADVELSTAPEAAPTHWKQTLVYLGTFIAVHEGDVLPARLIFQQSSSNPRHYDITVETS